MFTLDARLTAALATGIPSLVLRLTVLAPDGSVRHVFDVPRQRILSGSVRAELRRDVRRSASLELENMPGQPGRVTVVTSTTPGAITGTDTYGSGIYDGGVYDTGSMVVGAPTQSSTTVTGPSEPTILDLVEQGSRLLVETGALWGPDAIMVPLITGFVTTVSATMRGATVSVGVESYLSACSQEAGEAVLLGRGLALPDALHALWDPVLPTAEWIIEEVVRERTLGADIPVLPGDIRLDVGMSIARDLGCEAYDDRTGSIVVRTRRDPWTQASAGTVTDIIDLARSNLRQPVNAQPVEGTPGDGEPFYVVEEITDPASPIHRDRIGLRMAPTIRSDAVPDPATARLMARAWLSGRALAADTLDITEPAVHPGRDPGDIIGVTEPVTRTAGRYIIESVDTPLGPGTQGLTASAALPLFLTDATT